MKDHLGRLLLNWRIRAVMPYIKGMLLDIGCGTNQLVQAYNARHRAELGIGVDVYPWPGVDLLVKDTSSLPYESEYFDTITIVAALNHIPNREAVLRETRRLLKPGGRCIVTMIPPRLSRVWHWLRRSADVDQKDRGMKPGEVYGLTHSEVSRLLEEARFKVTEQTRFMLGVNRITVATKR